MLRSTHTSDFFYLTAGSCDPARQEHFYSALETFVRRWRPATFDYVVHTGRRRVSSGLAGPHPDSTDHGIDAPPFFHRDLSFVYL